MTNLVLASLFLPLSHFGLSSSRLRSLLAERLGERAFLALYQVIALVAFGRGYTPVSGRFVRTSLGFWRFTAAPIVVILRYLGDRWSVSSWRIGCDSLLNGPPTDPPEPRCQSLGRQPR